MKKILIIASLLICASSNAQDMHLSMYDAAVLNINPALTGLFKGNVRIHGQYRTQWSAVATQPYQTGIISVDFPIKKLAMGVQVGNFRAGAGNYNEFSPMLSLAYNIHLDKKNAHNISFGIQGGGYQKSIDMNKLTYETQFTPFGGGGFDPAVNNGENFASTAVFTPRVNAGIIYFYGKETARLNPFVGATLFNINEPTESFFSANNKLPMRLLVHGGMKINISEKVQLLPKCLFLGQKEARELTATLLLNYYLRGSDAYLIFGPTFRLSGDILEGERVYPTENDAAVVEAGLKYGRFTYRIAYDVNISSLNSISNGRGGLELSLTFVNNKYDPNPIKTCPRLY